jgi:hypothetical protein
MDMLIAKTVIHRTLKPGKAGDPTKNLKRVPPETEEIPSGSLFEPRDAAERAELINLGAAAPAPKGMTQDSARTASGKATVKAAAKGTRGPGRPRKEQAETEGDGGTTSVKPAGKGVTATTGTTKHGGDDGGDSGLV